MKIKLIFTIKILLLVTFLLIMFLWCYPGVELINQSTIRDIFLGMLSCVIFGMFNNELLDAFVDRDDTREKIRKIRDTWADIIPSKPEKYTIPPGEWLGLFERFLFFGSAYGGQYKIIGAWLVLKVAAKWESWKNVVQVPGKLPEGNTDEETLDWLNAKRLFGGWNMIRFQIGIILNILIGVGTAILIKNLESLMR